MFGSKAGGIVGYLLNAYSVTSCNNYGSVNGYYAGGIFGEFEENIRGEGYRTYSDFYISSCLSKGDVYAQLYAGGLIGYMFDADVGQINIQSSTVTECTISAEISDNIIQSCAGGLIGYCCLNEIIVKTSSSPYVTGSVTIVGEVSGGCIGWKDGDYFNISAKIGTSKLQQATVSGTQYVGGVIGYMNTTKNPAFATNEGYRSQDLFVNLTSVYEVGDYVTVLKPNINGNEVSYFYEGSTIHYEGFVASYYDENGQIQDYTVNDQSLGSKENLYIRSSYNTLCDSAGRVVDSSTINDHYGFCIGNKQTAQYIKFNGENILDSINKPNGSTTPTRYTFSFDKNSKLLSQSSKEEFYFYYDVSPGVIYSSEEEAINAISNNDSYPSTGNVTYKDFDGKIIVYVIPGTNIYCRWTGF